MGDSYSAAISKNAPYNGADLLRARALNGKHTNQRVADWLKDYSQVQKQYAQELERFLSRHVVDGEDFGTLTEPWQKVTYFVAEQHRLTSDLAKRIQVEAERPIREQAFWSRAERLIDELKTGSSSSATQTIDQIQKIDEQRLDNVKNSLVRFLTVEVDRGQAETTTAERAMQAWILYEPKDDVSSYVAQVVSGVAPLAPTTSPLGGGNSTNSRHASAATTSTSGTSVQPQQQQQQQQQQRQTSEASQSTVRRRASLIMGLGHKSDSAAHMKSPGGGLRSKVGSIFGRKKKDKGGSLSPQRTPPGAYGSAGAGRLTRPPDFGPRQHSQLSGHTLTSSPASSLRHQRIRDVPDDGLYSPSPPRRAPGTGAGSAAPPTSAAAVAASLNQPSAVPHFGMSNEDAAYAAPITPTKAQPRTAGSGNGQASPTRSQSPVQQHQQQQHQPDFQHQQSQQLYAQNSGAASLTQSRQPPQFGAPLDVPSDAAAAASHAAPAPPPTRSVHRQSSLNRTPSAASVQRAQRSGSLQRSSSQREARETRDSRVGSQVFTNLPPATDSGRNSLIVPGVSGLERSDKLGPLPPIPGTPHASAHMAAATPGSPEQFWTPAARFPTQFQSFEQANSSLASLSSARAPILPPLPAVEGLVAAAVEHIEAEYEGEELVRGSIKGEALAQVNGGAASAQQSIVLGILLADPKSKLTPSPLLRQTSSLSFDLPTNMFSAPHELVQYTAESAVGRVPLKLTPVWRFDTNTVRLVLSFQLSDLYVGGDEIEVLDLVIAVSIRGSARAQSAQSKPVATFSREKQRVTWRFTQPQHLRRGQSPTKLLCQFVTDGAPSQPGSIELKARLPAVTNSVLQLRTLSPQGEWVPVPTAVASAVHTNVHVSEDSDTLLPPSISGPNMSSPGFPARLESPTIPSPKADSPLAASPLVAPMSAPSHGAGLPGASMF